MKKISLILVLLLQLLISNKSEITLTIERSRSHSDQTGNLTPLIVSLSCPDTQIKTKPVDLICIVDTSGSMSGDKIQLVKESLKYLVNLMNEEDKFALIEFSNEENIINYLTKMTEENKALILKNIDNLYAYGGTNILDGLKAAVDLIEDDYSSGERVASLILLSDGEDNYNYDLVDDYFKDYLEETRKENYTFNLHTLGYGEDHDAVLMESIAKVKQGGFYFIQRLKDLQNDYLQIYGSLSTVCAINVILTIQSDFTIANVSGMEDFYNTTLDNSIKPNKFTTTLIQMISGKLTSYVVFVDVPSNTPYGTEVLRASISPQGISKKYLWDQTFSIIAYEEYIKSITVVYFSNGYYAGQYRGIQIITEGKTWIINYYNGTRNWVVEYDDAINDLQNYYSFGGANLLSKIHELKTLSIGNHYSKYNSYTTNIIQKSYNLDVSKLPVKKVIGEIIINFEVNINYYYFYLKEGRGTINNLPFSGESSSLIIYSDNPNSQIKISSISESLEYYYWNETKTRMQNVIDFSHEGKFIIEKNFPLEFYSVVDGTKDITFNIEFLTLLCETSGTINHSFEIIAYIVDASDIESLNYDINSLPSSSVYNGFYDPQLSIGKIVIKKETIYQQLSSTLSSYLYVIIKNLNSGIVYNHIEGQLLFFSMDNLFSIVPEGFTISSNLLEGEKSPHLYTLSGKNITIRFSNPGNELDCKIIKYQSSYPTGSGELYIDYSHFYIIRTVKINIIYITVIQPNEESSTTEATDDKVILSIFSKNENHIPDSKSSNSYAFNYTVNPMDDNYTGNYSDNYPDDERNYTEDETENLIDIRPKADVLFLGFAKFIYIRTVRIITFSMYFVHFKEIVYSEILIITMRIRYKVPLRGLQENDSKKAECQFAESGFDNQDKYNCSLETNGEEIDNIEVDPNFEFKNQKIEVKGISPFASKYMNNLQNVGDVDIFNKKMYILDEATSNIDNNNNEFSITGTINDENFNYKKLTLTINSNEEKNNFYNISCNVLNNAEKNYTLKCSSSNEMKADLNGAFSDLGNENLIVNYKDIPSDTINFSPKLTLRATKKGNKKLGAGGIIAIVASSLAVVIITIITIFCLRKKIQNQAQPDNNTTSATQIIQ